MFFDCAEEVVLPDEVRSGHASVEVDGKVYVIGGCLLDVQCFNDVRLLLAAI